MNNQKKSPSAAIIVPTLGLRPRYLDECIRSISNAGNSLIVIVSPYNVVFSGFVKSKVGLFIQESGNGLAAAINLAVANLPPEIEFFNWLGDDDLLTEDSISKCIGALQVSHRTSAVYGQCEYIDSHSKKVGVNYSGNWAKKILRFGPDLIPQPGALFRINSFNAVGGLNTQYKYAFDFDLFIKLQEVGELTYLPEVLGKFRWHSDSLSVKLRMASVLECSKVRKSYLSSFIRHISFCWESLIICLTYIAGIALTTRIKLTNQVSE
jgi:glycosyltransferase involved in cell wall biosynthesis